MENPGTASEARLSSGLGMRLDLTSSSIGCYPDPPAVFVWELFWCCWSVTASARPGIRDNQWGKEQSRYSV